ncbi:DAK1/DegV-like protein [Rickenella mellea]|uniref:DAK1/DegV-like protein n=1 Tax=Rickenella mellea TaxID=50990 RepID=A0A4Y7PMU8_9AGAM|nr:DAK1/DegV-like protein [Rickenella mellea]
MTSFALFQPFVGILPLISGSGKSCLSRAERMFTKHVFNDSDLDDLVPVSLRGALNPSLRLHRETKTVYTVHPSPNARVAVISGGGAGHESAHAGYTGNGMLTASVSGEIFASPSASQILTAIRLAVHSMKKPMDQSAVLLIVSNYTGDRLNFGLAAERARVLGIAVDIVVGAEDVSLLAWSAHPDSTERYEEPRAGPRGLAVNILVCKILGAAAANGSTLQELMSLGDAVTASLKSVGVGLAHCHVPRRSGDRNAGESQDADKLGKDECEIGMGLNNEPGARREVIGSAEYLGKRMVKMVIDALPREISADERYRDNDSGGIVDHTIRQLASSRIHPVRVYMAPYMTSLNMPGFSISLLDLDHIKSQGLPAYADVLNLLDMPTDATVAMKDESGEISAPRQVGVEPRKVDNAVKEACKSVFEVERDLTHFDTVAGDGDCGETFAARHSPHNNDFCIGCSEALNALRRYTPAEPGDRTIIDSLQPFCKLLLDGETGAEKTRGMKARLGRASYVREGNIVDVPDPGAWGVAAIVSGLCRGF